MQEIHMHWLGEDAVVAIHKTLIARFGGSDGVRDNGLLNSALARPKNLLAYGNPSIFGMAAAYAVGIVKNHPFVDGNKRTGFAAAAVFLDINGYELIAEEAEATVVMLGVASGECDETFLAQWLSDQCKRME